MSVELKDFPAALFAKDKALKKHPNLKPLVIAVKAPNKGVAESIIFGKLAEIFPAHIDDYFKPKFWEDREGLPAVVTNSGFHDDFFDDSVIWNAEKGEPERVLAEPELTNDSPVTEKSSVVKSLPANYRAASLVLFGPVEEITSTQYGQVMDLVNDDESSFARELAEAIAREPRVLELLPERQEELLAHIRETVKETAQWTGIKRSINKWLDTPPAKRDEKKPGMSELATRLRYRTAMGKLSRAMDFDVCSPPVGIEMRINTMLCSKDVEIDDWCAPFSRTPGIHDYHPASIVAIIKTADEKLHIYPGELRQYIDNCIAGFDCVTPPQVVIDIACGRTSAPLPQKNNEASLNDQTEQTLQDKTEIPAVCPSRAAELNRELAAAFAGSEPAERDEELRHKTSLMLAQQRGECIPELGDDPTDPNWDSMAGSASNKGKKTEVADQEDNRLPVDAREIEIAHALNDLLSGRTDIMGKEKAEGVVTCTSHLIAYVLPLLIIDIATTEFCLSPNFSDEEIHDVATTILDGWSDDVAVRQKIALDAIVEYRKPTPAEKAAPVEPEPMVQKQESVNQQLVHKAESVNQPAAVLTYHQQLTIAALQGLCANPLYHCGRDDISFMALELADEIIDAEDSL